MTLAVSAKAFGEFGPEPARPGHILTPFLLIVSCVILCTAQVGEFNPFSKQDFHRLDGDDAL